LGNNQIYHLEKPVLIIDGTFDRKRDLLRILSRKQLILKNGHEYPILVLKWDGDPTYIDEHLRLR